MPISLILGQIPVVWKGVTDLSEKQALEAALIGIVMRILSATAIAALALWLL